MAIIISSGCNKTEDITDELTPAQLEALQVRAAQECLATSPVRYSNFEEISGRIYDPTNVKWQRDYGWKHSLKQGSLEVGRQDIRVWKNTGNDLYLLINRFDAEGLSTKYFLRIPSAVNSQMIEDIKYETCLRRMTTSGSDNGPLTSEKIIKEDMAPGVREVTSTYTFDYTLPVYAGSEWKFTRKRTESDVPNTANTSVTVTGTLEEWTGQLPLSSTPPADAKYCDLPAVSGQPEYDYTLPYTVLYSSCPTVLPGAWSDFAI